MFSPNMDFSSILLFLIGKDSIFLPLIILLQLLIGKWDSIVKIYHNILSFYRTQYVITGTIYTNLDMGSTYGGLGDSIWALIVYMNDLAKQDKNLLSNAFSIKLPCNPIIDSNDANNILLPNSKTYVKLTDDITCRVEIKYKSADCSNPNEKNKLIDSTILTFTLSTTKSFDTIITFMDSIVISYKQKIKNMNKLHQYIIKPTYDPSNLELQCNDMIKLKTSKSFDNLFFDGKSELIQRLEQFKNRDKYKVLGLPETLGLLFYGEPGTGKTSCIKAIANYMDMSIIIVPMNQIKTKQQLHDLFFSTEIYMPQEKRIYVFEEIDCNGWENIIRDRVNTKETVNCDNTVPILEKLTETLQNNKSKKETKLLEDKLTLGSILEIIDGLIECPGRIIIMTTNHKDHIDSALLRPGRIDMSIEFKKLRRSHIAEIYNKWYGVQMNELYLNKIPDYIYTQAEISQLLFTYENDRDGFLQRLTKYN